MNNKKMLDIGSKWVDFNENFRIVLITKSTKIDIPEETKAYLTLIQFTTTLIGLTDQLISKTILHKNPKLEEKRVELLKMEGSLLQQKIDMEDNLLEELSNSQGDILKNEKLLRTLNEVKESSLKIDKSLQESFNLKSALEEEYKQYRDICSKAASLFLGINRKYELSSIVFSNLYLKTLEMKLDDLESYRFFVKSVFLYLCRSTTKEEHIILGTFICKNAFPDQIPLKKWELFVTNFMVTRDGESNYSIPAWVNKDYVSKVMALISQVPKLEEGGGPRRLSEEGGNSKPILLITEPENDPSDEIRNIAAKKLGSSDNYIELSVGKGMEKTLLELLRKHSTSSKWICFKNIHLMPLWLIDLDREFEMLKKAENFRMWLICEHTRNFPETVTYKFINILFEYPNGIKNKSKRFIQQEYGASLTKMIKDARSTKINILLYILTAVLQERRKYIPQGWSQKYEFGNADLKAAQNIVGWLENSFNSSKMDWSVLQNLCHSVAYGGRMNNSRDLEVLKKYLKLFFNNECLSNKWSPIDLGVNIPTTGNIQDVYNESRDAVEFYESDNSNSPNQQLLHTAQIKVYLDVIKMFLENLTPFIICGPSAAAKSLLIEEAVKEFSGYQLVDIHCSMQLTPSYILHILKQNSLTVSGIKGREYKPKQFRLILFFRNLDLCDIDSWGTSDVVELLLSLLEKQGFYNESLEWITVSGIHICASISESLLTTKKLSPRFMCRVGHLRIKHPSDSDMEIVLTNSLQPILVKFKKSYTTDVVESLTAFFRKVQESFMGKGESSHYHFTPKTLIKLINGLYNYPEDNFNEALLCEITSIFKDRLANQEDITIYNDIFRETMRRFLWVEKEKIFFIPKQSNIESFEALDPVTKELLDQTAKITRALSRPKNHLVILGEPGSRYLDSIYISASMYQAKVSIPQMTRNYSLLEFYNDLKIAMTSAAIDNQIVCMLLEQSLISFQPDVMKPIEAIMEESEIIDLFGEDLDSIANQLKSAAQLEGFQDSLSSFFMSRVQQNLHLIVVLNPKSSNTSKFFSQYPTFRRNAEFLYIRNMSEETVLSLPKMVIESQSEKVPISSYFTEILTNQYNKQPPKLAYQMINCYYYIYKSYNGNIQRNLHKLQTGVDKLASAHKVVGELKASALKQEESLAEKRKMANEALEKISSTMRNANEQKSTMLELRKK
uniref:Dynein heavy chain AAA module D4 domain-containing protein n=1 Tax=Megaselia scalaris TaxID=36166 RepID=T1GD24_MEGSC